MESLFSGVYKGTRVFLTGHTGFKGSWLALWLERMGALVKGYSLPPSTKPDHLGLLKIAIDSSIGDIRDRDRLTDEIKRFKPDIIFHLAAQPLVRYSYEHPVETFETNVTGTLNICEAARVCEVKALVAVTTDKVYENKEWIWGYRESDRLGGHDPYSSSKAAAEMILNAYNCSFFDKSDTLLTCVRAGNVIGGGDWSADRLIPDFARAFEQGKKVTIRNPHSSRPWQHVLDCLSGYLLTGKHLLQNDRSMPTAINFGPSLDDAVTVEEVIRTMKKYWPELEYEIQQNPDAPHEAGALCLDCTRAHSSLLWRPVWKKEQAFERTALWYRSFYQNRQVKSDEDLTAYIADARLGELIWA